MGGQRAHPPGAQSPGLRIATHNVCGLFRQSERGGWLKLTELVQSWACDLKADVVCVQETHMGEQLEKTANQLLRLVAAELHVPAYTAFWAPKPLKAAGDARPQAPHSNGRAAAQEQNTGNRSTGVAILVRSDKLSSGEIKLQLTDDGKIPKRQVGADGRSLRLRMEWRGHKLSLVNTYLPAKSQHRVKYIQTTLAGIIKDLPRDTRPVVCGDFNFTEDPQLDRTPHSASHATRDATAARAWQQAAAARELHDAHRYKHPARKEYTYYQRGRAARSRLDRFYVGEGLLGYVEQCCPAGKSQPSDHRPMVLHLRPAAPTTQGRGLRKLRLSALNTEEGKAALRSEIERVLAALQVSTLDDTQLVMAWPGIKAALSDAAAVLAKRHARRKAAPSAASKAAAAELQAAEQHLASVHQTQQAAATALDRAVRAHRAMAAATRADALPAMKAAKYKWLAEGERPSPLISALMDPPAGAGKIPCLRTPHGEGLITSGPQLAELAVDHYANVSRQPQITPEAQQLVLEAVRRRCTQIKPELAAMAGASQVTEEEVRAAMSSTKPHTSPGPDGIPAVMWRWCKDQLAPVLARLFTAMGTTNLAPEDFPQGAVVAIYKGAGDTTDLANHRPITLLNTDYRLLAKVLATRWGKALGTAIGKEQTAFLPDRMIGENVMLLQLLPAALAAQRVPGTYKGKGAAAFLDFQKAYDTVGRGFLFAVMEAVGAGGGMLQWARLLLADTQAVAVINGHVSTPRSWQAGVRQGCPLAPAMYLFVAWALSCWLEDYKDETTGLDIGITLCGKRVPCTQYADDTTPLLSGYREEHVKTLLNAMRVFEQASGQKLNLSKCKLVVYGWMERGPPPDTIAGIKVEARAKTLGMYFSEQYSNGEPCAASVDWDDLLRTVTRSYDKLSRLPMTMFGRALAAAGYGISTLLYHAEFAAMPDSVMQQLTRMTVKLVDRGLAPAASFQRCKLPGVRSDLLPGPPSKGGAGMLPWKQHITARHAVWAARLLEWLARMPFTRLTLPPAQCPPWTLAAAEILRGSNPYVHPALTFLTACLEPTSAVTIRSQPLERLAVGMAALGAPTRLTLEDIPGGPWCQFMPLWGNPLLRLEAPQEQRPPGYQRMVQTQAQAHMDQLPPPDPGPHRYTRAGWDWEMQDRHAAGWYPLQCLPQAASIQQLIWLDRRLERAHDTGTDLRQAVHWPGEQPRWDYQQRYTLSDMSRVRLMVKSLLVCVPRAWRDEVRGPGVTEAAMTTHALTLVLRSIGWDAAAVTSLPKQLRTMAGRAEAAQACTSRPEEWVPAAFQTQPKLQIFSRPLPFKVKLVTRLQQGPWRAAVRDMHLRCVRAALQLSPIDGQEGGQGQQQSVAELMQRLGPRLKTVWSLKWDNHYKETWWRLLLEGVQGAGGHGIALNGPCPCGWAAPAHLDAPARAAAQRDHVFWHCAPAVAVRRTLAHNLPEGVQLRAHHVWLLQPPCEAIHPQVWMVVGLAALTVMQSARKHMWALHMRQQEEAQGVMQQRAGGGRGARRGRNQAPAQPAAEPHIAATRRAAARLVDGVRDFVDMGRVPAAWVGTVGEDHAFIGVRPRPVDDNPGRHVHEMLYNMRVPADLIA